MVASPLIALAPTWFVTACTVFMISLFFLCLKWWQAHPKYGKNVGPPVMPIIGSFLSLVKNQDQMYEWATELLRQSPSLTIRNVLFGLEIYTTANPANVEYMLKTNFHNYCKGFRFQNLMEDMLGNGIFNVDGELWKVQRKVASYEFTSSSLKTMMLEMVQKEITNRLLPVLYDHMCRAKLSCGKAFGNSSSDRQCHSSCRAPIDLQDIFLQFTSDNICQISLGVDPACLSSSLNDDNFAKAFDDATEMITLRFYMPAWIWKFKRFLNVGSERRLKKALHVVHSFAAEVIRRRKQERIHAKDDGIRHQHGDLLFRLLPVTAQSLGAEQQDELASKVSEDSKANRNFHKDHTDAKSDKLLRDMVISFLLAGRDTSSIALSWFFWLLIQHPHVEAAIFNEITSVMQASRKSRYACLLKLEFDHQVREMGGKHPGDDLTCETAIHKGRAHEVNKDDVTVHSDGVGNISVCKQQGVMSEGNHGTSNEGLLDDVDGNHLPYELSHTRSSKR